MKLLFVLEHFYPYIGGAENLFYVLTTALVKEGYDVVVITTRFDDKLLKEENHKGVKIVRVNCWNRFGFTFFSLPSIIHHARNAHIIHTTTYNAALPAIISGKILKKPVYVTFHEVWGNLWKRLPFTTFTQKHGFYYFEKLLLSLPFNKYIAVSDFTKNKLQEHGIPENKIIRIYNGLNYTDFGSNERKPNSLFTFTYFGRLGISKGLDLLIPAAAQFKKAFPNSKFKLIIPKHPRPLYEKILDLIKDNELESYIDFKHNLSKDELFYELSKSSCVVIASYSEGFCFAAAEAVALKVPIISSHQGALPEVVSGKFIKIGQMDVESLTAALTKAYHENWMETPILSFHLKDTVEAYKSLYNQGSLN